MEWYQEEYNWLKTTFGHHWLGQGILTLLVFVLVTLVVNFAYNKSIELIEQ